MKSSLTVGDLQKPIGEHRQIIDVRSPSEFAAGHIPGAVNIPLDQLESRIADLDQHASIVLVCQMGNRARMAAALVDPCQLPISVLEGGTSAWIQSGLPVVANRKTRWSLERQVRLAAGLLILMGSSLALTWSPHWIFLCTFIGLGLTFAGLSDLCPMAEILMRMPWNKNSHCDLGAASTAGATKSVIPNTVSGMQE